LGSGTGKRVSNNAALTAKEKKWEEREGRSEEEGGGVTRVKGKSNRKRVNRFPQLHECRSRKKGWKQKGKKQGEHHNNRLTGWQKPSNAHTKHRHL